MKLEKDWKTEEVLDWIRKERDNYIREYGLTSDDIWVLLDREVHKKILKECDRTTEGPDRMTRSTILGMHAIHDKMKGVYVIPKQRLPQQDPRERRQ